MISTGVSARHWGLSTGPALDVLQCPDQGTETQRGQATSPRLPSCYMGAGTRSCQTPEPVPAPRDGETQDLRRQPWPQ